MITAIHRSELMQAQLKVRRKRKRKEKILQNFKRICRNLSSWHEQITVRAFKDKLERDQFKGAQQGSGFYTKVREWQPKTLKGTSKVYHGN